MYIHLGSGFQDMGVITLFITNGGGERRNLEHYMAKDPYMYS